MKTAAWMIFIFVMGIAGIVIINIFGNITTTNQQDYTLVKNATEAAMYDALDIASYRSGFYLCSGSGTTFTSTSQYQIILNKDVDEKTLASNGDCKLVVGEFKISADVFSESILRRFASNINNSKSYKVTIQEVIEYPPKVSVRVDTYNSYNNEVENTETFETGDFTIRNQVDGILEKIG